MRARLQRAHAPLQGRMPARSCGLALAPLTGNASIGRVARRSALTPGGVGELRGWHARRHAKPPRRVSAAALSQRVVAATFDGFHRSPSLAAPQPLLTNHADAAQRVESRRSVIARCTNVLTNEPSSRSPRHSILPCGAFSPTSAPRCDVVSAALRSRLRPQTKRRHPGTLHLNAAFRKTAFSGFPCRRSSTAP